MCVPAPPASLPLPLAVVVRVVEQQSKAQMQADGKEFGQDGALVAGSAARQHHVVRRHDSGSQQPSCNSNLEVEPGRRYHVATTGEALCLILDT
jgi:hypothetical protein